MVSETKAAYRIQFLCFDTGIKSKFVMLLNDHHHFFQRSIAGSFAKAVDGTFNLPCTGYDAGNGIGCCKSKIIMTMTGDDSFIYVGNVIDQAGDFFTILVRQAITCCIRDIYSTWHRH